LKNNRSSIKSPIGSTNQSEKAKEANQKRTKPLRGASEVSIHSGSTVQTTHKMVRAPITPPKPLAIRHRFLEGFAISCLAIGLFLGLSMFSYRPAKNATQLVIYAANNIGGQLGYYTARWLFLQIGTMAYVLPAVFTYIGVLSFKNRLLDWHADYLLALCQCLGFTFIMVAGCGFNASVNFHHGLPYPVGSEGISVFVYY
jgi:hypothetical protein